VNTHDFPDRQNGKAIPYGVYDLSANTGWVNVGTDHDTAEFAVASIRRWWQTRGRHDYPQAGRLLITADAGGSNGYRTRAWKTELAAPAAESGLAITVCHLPPGTSKWNKIEHRLFSHITMNWRGRPLTSHDVIVQSIAATTTRTGLRVHAALDTGDYDTGVQISDAQIAALPITRHRFHGDWNYTLRPHSSPPNTHDAVEELGQSTPQGLDRTLLTHPDLTGMPREQLAAITVELAEPQARQHEQSRTPAEAPNGAAPEAQGDTPGSPTPTVSWPPFSTCADSAPKPFWVNSWLWTARRSRPPSAKPARSCSNTDMPSRHQQRGSPHQQTSSPTSQTATPSRQQTNPRVNPEQALSCRGVGRRRVPLRREPSSWLRARPGRARFPKLTDAQDQGRTGEQREHAQGVRVADVPAEMPVVRVVERMQGVRGEKTGQCDGAGVPPDQTDQQRDTNADLEHAEVMQEMLVIGKVHGVCERTRRQPRPDARNEHLESRYDHHHHHEAVGEPAPRHRARAVAHPHSSRPLPILGRAWRLRPHVGMPFRDADGLAAESCLRLVHLLSRTVFECLRTTDAELAQGVTCLLVADAMHGGCRRPRGRPLPGLRSCRRPMSHMTQATPLVDRLHTY
jgi:hypothetical protein